MNFESEFEYHVGFVGRYVDMVRYSTRFNLIILRPDKKCDVGRKYGFAQVIWEGRIMFGVVCESKRSIGAVGF